MQRNSPARSFLSPEECALIEAACVTLRESNKPSKFAFWGKIHGIQNDYYIVQSYVFVPQEHPATFYSRDGLTWFNLAPAADALISSGAYLNGPFTGEPTTPYTYSISELLTSNAAEKKPPLENTIREEERLAYVVRCVDDEGMMIPKYSYDNEVVGPVVPAPSYRGMSFDDCSNLENYLTFNPTSKAQWRSAVAAGDRARQMLQPLLHSCPENLTDHPMAPHYKLKRLAAIGMAAGLLKFRLEARPRRKFDFSRISQASA
ncbi:hypothetical protein RvY_00011 [Ramazzottius varieornatus]|uniref:Radial spoke head protein 9 homolog n=1 Tax=Ramazzottius varieornatus TaxID=947166 RepID=A0A1D1UB57_RAMVA|nr:hypothetical protein RvY_00011 [Ramazzottius varieornatus]